MKHNYRFLIHSESIKKILIECYNSFAVPGDDNYKYIELKFNNPVWNEIVSKQIGEFTYNDIKRIFVIFTDAGHGTDSLESIYRIISFLIEKCTNYDIELIYTTINSPSEKEREIKTCILWDKIRDVDSSLIFQPVDGKIIFWDKLAKHKEIAAYINEKYIETCWLEKSPGIDDLNNWSSNPESELTAGVDTWLKDVKSSISKCTYLNSRSLLVTPGMDGRINRNGRNLLLDRLEVFLNEINSNEKIMGSKDDLEIDGLLTRVELPNFLPVEYLEDLAEKLDKFYTPPDIHFPDNLWPKDGKDDQFWKNKLEKSDYTIYSDLLNSTQELRELRSDSDESAAAIWNRTLGQIDTTRLIFGIRESLLNLFSDRQSFSFLEFNQTNYNDLANNWYTEVVSPIVDFLPFFWVFPNQPFKQRIVHRLFFLVKLLNRPYRACMRLFKEVLFIYFLLRFVTVISIRYMSKCNTMFPIIDKILKRESKMNRHVQNILEDIKIYTKKSEQVGKNTYSNLDLVNVKKMKDGITNMDISADEIPAVNYSPEYEEYEPSVFYNREAWDISSGIIEQSIETDSHVDKLFEKLLEEKGIMDIQDKSYFFLPVLKKRSIYRNNMLLNLKKELLDNGIISISNDPLGYPGILDIHTRAGIVKNSLVDSEVWTRYGDNIGLNIKFFNWCSRNIREQLFEKDTGIGLEEFIKSSPKGKNLLISWYNNLFMTHYGHLDDSFVSVRDGDDPVRIFSLLILTTSYYSPGIESYGWGEPFSIDDRFILKNTRKEELYSLFTPESPETAAVKTFNIDEISRIISNPHLETEYLTFYYNFCLIYNTEKLREYFGK